MAALEYLTTNSLISYPFKDGSHSATHPIDSRWFLDMIVAPTDKNVRRVFLKQLRFSSSQLFVVFSDYNDAAGELAEVVVPRVSIVDNSQIADAPFFGFSSAALSGKLVFGDALAPHCDAGAFDYTYANNEYELSSGAIHIAAPRVTSLGFASMQLDDTYSLAHVFLSSDASEPYITNGSNTKYMYAAPAGLDMHVGRGLGTGLFDGCDDDSGSVYTMNGVKPNSLGNMFLAVSSCYELSALTAAKFDELSVDLENPLGPYVDFPLFLGGTHMAATAGNSIVLKNNCRPKCPPEAMTATAAYLNRLNDGFADLVHFINNEYETCGLTTQLEASTTFTASSFCGDNSLTNAIRRTTAAGAYVPCNSEGFFLNFHEGRHLLIRHTFGDVRRYLITKVNDAYSVELDRHPVTSALPGPFAFKVEDFGVGASFKNQITNYNDVATLQNTRPYVEYVANSSESYSSAGVYATFFALSVAVYNPGTQAVAYHVTPTPVAGSTAVQVDQATKIRSSSGISYGRTSGTLGCREYAFVEVVFECNCGTEDTAINIVTQLGAETLTHTELISVSPCPPSMGGTGGPDDEIVFYSNTVTYFKFSTSDSAVRFIIAGSIPSWIHVYTSAAFTANLVGRLPPDSGILVSSYSYISVAAVDSAGVAGAARRFKLRYCPTPLVNFPKQDAVIPVKKGVTYTADSPVVQVLAYNPPFDYIFSTTQPVGLSINSAGQITGTVSHEFRDTVPVSYSIRLHRSGDAAIDSVPVTGRLAFFDAVKPVITAPASVACEIGRTYTVQHPLLTVSATYSPTFTASNLPAGLVIDPVTGKVTGSTSEDIVTGSSTTALFSASNTMGTDSVRTVITMVVTQAPVITAPVFGSIFSIYAYQNYTSAAPVATIVATRDATSFTATGLPAGFSITEHGDIIGYTSMPGTFNITVRASNSIGTGSSMMYALRCILPVPVITHPAESATISVSRGFRNVANNSQLRVQTNIPVTAIALATPIVPDCEFTFNNTGTLLGMSLAGSSNTPTLYSVSMTARAAGQTSAARNFFLKLEDYGNPRITSIARATYAGAAWCMAASPNVTYPSTTSGCIAYVSGVTDFPTSYSLVDAPAGISISQEGRIYGTYTTDPTIPVQLLFQIIGHNTLGDSLPVACSILFFTPA